jgi:hypothetical protein
MIVGRHDLTGGPGNGCVLVTCRSGEIGLAPISLKEIARLERNEVGKPHAKTLEVIAARLGVHPTEIGTY